VQGAGVSARSRKCGEVWRAWLWAGQESCMGRENVPTYNYV